jgi:esterase/lipase superfamily enzyme
MARNQIRSATLVAAKMVPAVSEVWRRQALHWNSWRDRISL